MLFLYICEKTLNIKKNYYFLKYVVFLKIGVFSDIRDFGYFLKKTAFFDISVFYDICVKCGIFIKFEFFENIFLRICNIAYM